MTDNSNHEGQAVLDKIRKQQREELQRRTTIDPTMEHIIHSASLSSLIAEIQQLEEIMSDGGFTHLPPEIMKAISDVEVAVAKAHEIVEQMTDENEAE
jgi:hypothetical protein